MANWYVDNVTGNIANSGTSPGAAKALPEQLVGLTSPGDTVYQKATGVDYVWTTPAVATTLWTSCLWTNYVGDTTKPYNTLIRSSTTGNVYIIAGFSHILNIDFEFDWGANTSSGTSTPPLQGDAGNNVLYTTNCKWDLIRSTANVLSTPRYVFTKAAGLNVDNCEFIGDGKHYVVGSSNNSGFNKKISNSKIYNIGSADLNKSGLIFNWNIFERNIVNTIFLENRGVVHLNATTFNKCNNNVYMIQAGDSFTDCAIWSLQTSANQYFNATIIDNISEIAKTAGSMYLYHTQSTAQTYVLNSFQPQGNNPYFGTLTAISQNITNFNESYGASPLMSSSPFLSITFGDPDYAKLDTSNSDAIAYCIGKSVLVPDIDVGVYQTASGGGGGVYPDPDFVESSQPTYGPTGVEHTPNYIAPSDADVRDGETFGPNNTDIGRLELPTASQVLNGIGFGTDGTEFTGNVVLPTASQVLDAITFGPLSSLTGNIVLPSINTVTNGTTFGPSSSLTGNVVLPTASQVLDGVSFGSLSSISGNVILPLISQVLNGIAYGPLGSLIGTLSPSGGTGKSGFQFPNSNNQKNFAVFKRNKS